MSTLPLDRCQFRTSYLVTKSTEGSNRYRMIGNAIGNAIPITQLGGIVRSRAINIGTPIVGIIGKSQSIICNLSPIATRSNRRSWNRLRNWTIRSRRWVRHHRRVRSRSACTKERTSTDNRCHHRFFFLQVSKLV